MKKYICILASALLLAACEQRTETVAPTTASPGTKTETNTTIVNPSPAVTTPSTANTMTPMGTPSDSLTSDMDADTDEDTDMSTDMATPNP